MTLPLQTSDLGARSDSKNRYHHGPMISPSQFSPMPQNSHVHTNPFLPFSQAQDVPPIQAPMFPYYTNHTLPVVPMPGTQYNHYNAHTSPLNPFYGSLNVPASNLGPVTVPTPGLDPRELNPRISEYSYPNIIPQENSHENSRSSTSSWSSGFTRVLQDLTLEQNESRTPSLHTQEIKVSQLDFNRAIASTKDIVQAAYLSLNNFFDVSQIRTIENFYLGLERHIAMIIPYNGEFDIKNLVLAMRNLQSRIEDKIINFYTNLSDREKAKVVLTLPHLQNRSFVQAVVSPAGHQSESSINQSVNSSVHKSGCHSVNPNDSLGQKSPNQDFAYVRTSSPTRDHEIPKFRPWESENQEKDKMLVKNLFKNNKPSKSSSPSAREKAKYSIFLQRKSEIESEVNELLGLALDEKMQPSTLKLRALDVKSKLTSLDIDKWINDDKVCQIDPLELNDWENKIGKQIAKVLYQSEDKLNIRKGLAQSGLKKRDPPSFSGSVLDFPLFKKNWAIEVSQGGLPELVELNHLKTAVPSSAKDRLYEVETLEEAWSILNRIYGKEFDLRNKLKQEFLAINISSKTSPSIEIEIYQKVHRLASRIKAAKAQNLLETDFEYISLVYQFLPESQKEKWISITSSNNSNPTWDSFYIFLEEVYERALLKKQINESCKQSSQIKVCTKCKRTGHLADKCYDGKVLTTVTDVENCPVCNDDLHSIEIKVGNTKKQTKGDRLYNCPKYNQASDDEKRAIYLRVKDKFSKFCKHCTSWWHDASSCKSKNYVKCKTCNNNHFEGACALQNLISCASVRSNLVKLCVQDIPAISNLESNEKSPNARVLFDLGSQTTLVRDNFAEQLGWSYTPAHYSLAGIGSDSKIIQGKLWNVSLRDKNGQIHITKGYGVPSILKTNWSFPDIKEVAGQFPNIPAKVFLAQSSKQLDILVGTDSLSLLPKCIYGPDCKDCKRGLCCYQSKFGLGWVPVGQCNKNSSSHISCPSTFSVCLQKVVPQTRESFFLGEALGSEPIPTCSSCRSVFNNCNFCSSDKALCSAQEELEYRYLKDNCKFEAALGHLTAKYPWVADPAILQDNGSAAWAFQKRLEAKQIKEGNFDEYKKCFQDMIDRNVVSEITSAELQAWKGPINYNTHHDVLKDSATTPVRLVSNSSFNNGSTNLNDLLVKGPNTLNCLFSNLVRFRGYEVALVGDISKAYNSIKTGQIERHVRRYFFRFSQNEPWKIYGANCVMFGDRPAASLMTIAVERASESYSEVKSLDIDSSELIKDAEKLRRDSYVDDINTGGSQSDVSRMMGFKDSVSNQFTGTIPRLLNNVGLSLKALIQSGSSDEEAIAKLSGTVLGYKWEPTADIMAVKFKFNPSKKRKGIKSRPDLTLSDLEQFETSPLSRRQVLSLCNGIYDPLGIASPYSIKLKLLIRNCLLSQDRSDTSSKKAWDTTIPNNQISKWAELVREGITQDSLTFNRTVRPSTAVKAPSLVGFFDGSSVAMAGAIYIRYMCLKDKTKSIDHKLVSGCPYDSDFDPNLHEFKTSLVTAKARVTPLDGLSIPRSELSALQLLTRLLAKTVKALPETLSEIHILGDSTCVISAMDKVATSFNPYMHSRISDIHHTLDTIQKQVTVLPIQHIPSKENVADMATRNETLVSSIGPESLWQLGPKWLTLPRLEWPATRAFTKEELPDVECKNPIKIFVSTSQTQLYRCPFVINALKSCNDYYEALRKVTKNILDVNSRLASIKTKHTLIQNTISNSEAAKRAWSLLFEDAMGETDLLFSQGKLKNFEGTSKTIDGINRTIHVTTGRLSSSAVAAVSGQTELPILAASSELAKLIVLTAHRIGGHKMAKDTIARTRQIAYIHRPGKLVQSVLNSCNLCKIKKEKTSQQLMGKLPSYRVCPTPPFQKVSVDLVGHFLVKPTLTSRTQVKVWILMYLCDVSKALHTEVIDSMSSSALINAFRSCFAIRNTPEQISSDPGKCFVGAKNRIQKDLDQTAKDLVDYWPSINWIIHPTEAPWRNGSVEALVKQLKSSFKMLPNFKLSLLEFKTLIAEITTSINNRPLGTLQDDQQPLTPNQLLLGRNFSPVSPGTTINADSSLLGLKGYIQNVYSTWWARWEIDVFPKLFIPGPKWNKTHSNVKIGDIGILISHKGSANKMLTMYKYCKVTKLIESEDGLVRKVNVEYRIPSLKKKEICIDIRRLVILPNITLDQI